MNLFGTPEENGYSIFRAIERNPSAFVDRTLQMAKQLPSKILNAYGYPGTVLFFVFAIFGLKQLIAERRYQIIGWVAAWLIGLLVYFFTFFREGYFTLPLGVLIFLVVLGLQKLVLEKRAIYHWEEIAATLFLLSLGVFGIYADKSGWVKIGFCACILIAGIVVCRKYPVAEKWKNLLTMGILVGILLPLPLPSRLLPDLGQTQKEQAAQWLIDHYPPATRVVEYRPQLAALAKMEQLGFPDLGLTGNYMRWLDENKINLVFQYPISVDVPYIDSLFKSSPCLQLAYQSTDSSLKIWQVNYPCIKQKGSL